MKMVVVKSPKFLAGLFRIIFRIKKEQQAVKVRKKPEVWGIY